MKGQKGPSEQRELDRALALLISATKRKKRSVPLTRIAEAVTIAREHLGSIAKVAATVGLTGKMLGQFCRVNDLLPEARELVENRAIDSVDAVVHLTQLDSRAQREAALALAEHRLDTKDLRGVVELYKTTSGTPFSEILERVRSSKTQRHYVIEFVVRGSLNEAELRKRFQQFASPENILDICVLGSLGRVVFNKEGYRELRERARQSRLGLKELATLATMPRTP